MEYPNKIDIKSEVYRAAVPHIVRFTKIAVARFRELPKLDICRNFILMYLAVGFILEGIAGAVPALALSFIGISPDLVGFSFFIFWPAISFFMLGGQEHTILSLAVLFIGATYMTDIKQKRYDAQAALLGVQSRMLLSEQHHLATNLETVDTTADIYESTAA
jgi:hypothetical protein